MDAMNRRKASLLYEVLDSSMGFYSGRAAVSDRSLMNVSFNVRSPEAEQRFHEQATAAGFSGLAGHRAVGGVRASLYNGLTLAAVEKLANFMVDFQRQSKA
jgi:phosphoserine aminotransferase